MLQQLKNVLLLHQQYTPRYPSEQRPRVCLLLLIYCVKRILTSLETNFEYLTEVFCEIRYV